jgi:membrane fusion protein, heavy metal efflux system
MHAGPAGRITVITATLAALLLGSLLVTGACSKKEQAIEKSAQTGSKAEAEKKDTHSEGVVELSPAAIKTAGIEVVPVAETTSPEVIGATAVIELNSDRVSRVSPRVAGRCVTVKGSLGDRVQAGQVLAQIDSLEVGLAWSEFAKSKAQLDLAAAERMMAEDPPTASCH